jgi:hypothetical protein
MPNDSSMPPIVKTILAVLIAAMVVRVILARLTQGEPEGIYISPSPFQSGDPFS